MRTNPKRLLPLMVIIPATILGSQQIEIDPKVTGYEPELKLAWDMSSGEEGLKVRWTGPGILEQSTSPLGPWTRARGTRGRSLFVKPSGDSKAPTFYRVHAPLSMPAPGRPARVWLPDDYDENKLYPLVINLHGWESDPDELETTHFPLAHLVDERQFILSDPIGLLDEGLRIFSDNPTGWNATDGCCKSGDEQTRLNDVLYLSKLIETIRASYSVDPAMIYVTGFGPGGFMVHRMLCDRSDILAGGASLAGVVWNDPSKCQPSHPVHLLHIQSIKASIVPWKGGILFGPIPAALDSMNTWKAILGCEGELVETGETLDLDLRLEGDDTDVLRYSSCPNVSLELWRLNHSRTPPTHLRGGESSDLPESVLDWLFARSKR